MNCDAIPIQYIPECCHNSQNQFLGFCVIKMEFTHLNDDCCDNPLYCIIDYIQLAIAILIEKKYLSMNLRLNHKLCTWKLRCNVLKCNENESEFTFRETTIVSVFFRKPNYVIELYRCYFSQLDSVRML